MQMLLRAIWRLLAGGANGVKERLGANSKPQMVKMGRDVRQEPAPRHLKSLCVTARSSYKASNAAQTERCV
jgi:hypothetical protein